MLQHTLTKHVLNTFTDTLLPYFSPQNPYHRELFSNGLKLYRDGNVFNTEATDTLLTGTVQALQGKVYVTIGLTDFTETTCTCTNRHYCEHIFAVLFYAYATVCGIGELLTKWKDNPNTSIQKIDIPIKKAPKKIIDYTPDKWETIFQTNYATFQKEVANPTPFDYYYRLLPRLLKDGPEDSTLSLIYRLQMSYIILSCMYQSLKNAGVSSTFSNQHILNRLYAELNELVSQLQHSDMTAYESLICRLLDALEVVIEEQTEMPLDLYDQYRTLWLGIHQGTSLLTTTIQQIEQEKARGVRSSWYDYKLAHLYFLQERDQEALKLLVPHLDSVATLFFWIDYYIRKEKWEHVKRVLTFTHALVCRFLHTKEHFSKTRMVLGSYLSYYLTHTEIAKDEQIEQIFQDTWPYSVTYYEEYLIDKEYYERWVELTAYLNVDVLYERKNIIKLIEKEAPYHLLPLYHQHVMVEINRKNRSSYKQAIRYLKKLRTIYRKQKELLLWEKYIHKLASSTTRLRAFQEELRRAKLIEN